MSSDSAHQPGGTNTAPIFMQNARDLIRRLVPHANDPVVRQMLREAETLLDSFDRWKLERPANEVRIAGIQQLMNLNRQAMDYLTKSRPSPIAPPHSAPRERQPSLIGRFFRRLSTGGGKG